MRRTGQMVEGLRAWLMEIAEEQFQRHRRWLRGLAPEQERLIRKQLLPSVVNRLALACVHERPWCALLLENGREVVASASSRWLREERDERTEA